ncbi:MAG: transglycosylase SLT domain-containing protein [Acidobacteria bacterium]|nr:transglycosylase SLT domain-containing protein [Acidobacteriota bacterium]NIM62057.1 transglycosylase SLT domain-containing protein [Acidobacteriota bacterium]NIO59706.1 transglycosylase SLT domain-containing protein [Acidobacteriota bacterium]NIQ30795.1 transglycosylase SLT domain-containing protein [Acidobacteriota bacterium]NIQ85857.1 transglycosylase SLT domain-containing protein [Acidobacteriota bacterium]
MHGARRRSGLLTIAPLAILAVLFPPRARAGDALYYKEEGGAIVFTNVRGSGLQPLPGFSGRREITAVNALPSTPYDRFIEYLATKTAVSADLIKAVALVESGFTETARSPKGALGLMQLMPATARRYGVTNPFDPHENLQAGARHLGSLLDRYDGDLTLTLAAYNAGSGAVRRYGGVPPYRETRDYIRKIRDLLGGRAAAGPKASSERRTRGASSSPVRVVYKDDGTIALVN